VIRRFGRGWIYLGILRVALSRSPSWASFRAGYVGLTEAKTPLVLFVDDDNVLAENYLEESMRIGAEYSLMGTWGGSMIAEYECNPPE